MKVRLSGSARAYLRTEAAYLRDHSPKAAAAFLARMREAQRNLTRFPDLGRGIERLPVKGSRGVVVGDYLLDYDIDGENIIIVSILHGQQSEIRPDMDDDTDYES